VKTRTQKFREKIKYCISEMCFYIRLAWPEMLYPAAAYLIGCFGSYILLQNDSIKNFVFNLLNTTDIAYITRFFGWIAEGMVLLFYIVIWVIFEIEIFLEKKKEEHSKK